MIGLIYTLASWQAGKLAARFGYFNALKFGFGLMAVGLASGLLLHTVGAKIVTACITNIGMCFIWPTIEALVSEGDTPEHVPHAVGIYNITWAATNAAAFFIGGTLYDHISHKIIFYLPLAMVIGQFGLVFWLKILHANLPPAPAESKMPPPDPNRPSPARAKTFLRMAWLANPFAYVAINTVIPLIPDLARKLELSPTLAGFFCSIWFFARLGTFVILWLWAGWHYRFGFLLAAYLLLIASFAVLLLVAQFWVILVAQIIFGLAIGLIYYSSLFYSMDVGETKGEHGGVHEAAIGAGIFLGPAVGATALRYFPQHSSSSIWAVSGLLLVGLAGLVWLRYRKN